MKALKIGLSALYILMLVFYFAAYYTIILNIYVFAYRPELPIAATQSNSVNVLGYESMFDFYSSIIIDANREKTDAKILSEINKAKETNRAVLIFLNYLDRRIRADDTSVNNLICHLVSGLNTGIKSQLRYHLHKTDAYHKTDSSKYSRIDLAIHLHLAGNKNNQLIKNCLGNDR